ncbi:MAG: hypothetical protein DRP47_06135 [Candidatus Zixiibacteriota bacterium]|nr:MAG: hypothetical protein DRP47_06135 [candidate division Zixibacteria bacterium]
MRGMIHDCFVEMIERKAIWMFVVVTLIASLIILATSSFDMQLQIEGQSDIEPLSGIIDVAATKGLNAHLGFMMFLAVLATAGLLPNMLVRGRAEYYLSKPISRTGLFLGKLISIWLVYGGAIVTCGVISLALLYLIHGYANINVIYLFVQSLLSFFIWLSVTTFASITFGSTAFAMMSAFLVFVLQMIFSYHEIFRDIVGSRIMATVGDVLYYIFPKMGKISDIGENLAMGRVVDDWIPVWSSVIFAMGLIWVTVIIFNRKDY